MAQPIEKVNLLMHAESGEFLDALAQDLPSTERLILCGFPGNPNTAPPNAWRPRPWRPGVEANVEPNWNVYTTVASFTRAEDNTFRRRTESFAAGRALMVDDIGTKVDPKLVEHMPPSAVVETSPGNFQWWYLLDKPERDRARFDGTIRAFIYGQLLGNDPGMNGVNRVGRLPGFVNGKPQHNGWRCALTRLDGRRWSMEELIKGFKLQLQGRRYEAGTMRTEIAQERARMWVSVHRFLSTLGMMKRSEPDPSGWIEMHCPWVEGHSDRADTGAAMRRPNEDNGWYGGFRCHHGHCAEKGWQELTEWVAEGAGELLEMVNASDKADAAFRRTLNHG